MAYTQEVPQKLFVLVNCSRIEVSLLLITNHAVKSPLPNPPRGRGGSRKCFSCLPRFLVAQYGKRSCTASIDDRSLLLDNATVRHFKASRTSATMAEAAKSDFMPVAAKKRRLRFGLRTLLVLVVVLAVPIAWVANERHQSQQEQEIAQRLRENGLRVQFSHPEELIRLPSGQLQKKRVWLRKFVGNLLGERIESITASSNGTALTDLSLLAELTDLHSLSLSKTQVQDITPLARLTKLEHLNLYDTQVSDLTPLATMRNLRSLDLERTQVSDIEPLAKLTTLAGLKLSGTQVSDLKPLAGFTNLRSLALAAVPVSDITPLSKLTNMSILDLSDTKVSNIEPLAGLANLEMLELITAPVDESQIEAFKKTHPNCHVR